MLTISEWTLRLMATVKIPDELWSRPCHLVTCKGTAWALAQTLYVDEGDGGVSVDMKCDRCGAETGAGFWAIADDEFESLFGYPFGERPDEEDDR